MNMLPWLSPQIVIGDTWKPIYPKRLIIHMAWQQQSEIAMYSASVDDKAMVFWALESQDTEDLANLKE